MPTNANQVVVEFNPVGIEVITDSGGNFYGIYAMAGTGTFHEILQTGDPGKSIPSWTEWDIQPVQNIFNPNLMIDFEVIADSNGKVRGAYQLDYAGVLHTPSVSASDLLPYESRIQVPVVKKIEVVSDANARIYGVYGQDFLGGFHEILQTGDPGKSIPSWNTWDIRPVYGVRMVDFEVISSSGGAVKGAYQLDNAGVLHSPSVNSSDTLNIDNRISYGPEFLPKLRPVVKNNGEVLGVYAVDRIAGIHTPIITTTEIPSQPTNNPPVTSSLTANPTSGPAGTTFTFTAQASDPDNNPLTYLFDLNDGNGFRNNGASNTISAQYTTPGTFTIRARANDGTADSNTLSAQITVTQQPQPPQNRAPVLNPIGNKQVTEGQTLAFTLSASDADNDPLSFSASNLPAGATFIGRTFSWTPAAQQVGTHSNIRFTVSDLRGGTDTDTISITVQPPLANRAPIINSITTNSPVGIGNNLTITVDASDPDGDPLRYLFELNFGTLRYQSNVLVNSRTFPSPNQPGEYPILVVVSDNKGGTVRRDLTVTYLPQPEQVRAILASPSSDQILAIGDAITVRGTGRPSERVLGLRTTVFNPETNDFAIPGRDVQNLVETPHPGNREDKFIVFRQNKVDTMSFDKIKQNLNSSKGFLSRVNRILGNVRARF